ncbi:MAG: DUF948 domain-containing protein [Exiguobacterium oxidotolerans]
MEITLGGIAGLVAAIAFVVLVIFLARVLGAASKTLNNVADTTAGLERQLDGIMMETTALLHKTNRLVDTIEEKTELLAPVANSIEELGTSLNKVTDSVRTVSDTVAGAADTNKEQIAQAVRWGSVAVELFKKNKPESGQPVSSSSTATTTVEKKQRRRFRKQADTPATPEVVSVPDVESIPDELKGDRKS